MDIFFPVVAFTGTQDELRIKHLSSTSAFIIQLSFDVQPVYTKKLIPGRKNNLIII